MLLRRSALALLVAMGLVCGGIGITSAADTNTKAPAAGIAPPAGAPVQSSQSGRKFAQPVPLAAKPVASQTPPSILVTQSLRSQLEYTPWHYDVLKNQWVATKQIPAESFISRQYVQSRDNRAASMSLKQAVYLALRNNPEVASAKLTPLASLQSVKQAYAVFDPNLTGKIDEEKNVTPSGSTLLTGGSESSVNKLYDWDFGVQKVLSTTNGTFGITFNNQRASTNSVFTSINPSYSPFLAVSLSQPLLRNFGWDFATINVRIAEANQVESQFNYERQLSDFVQRVCDDYWNVVGAERTLESRREGYRLAADLVRQNRISVKVGTLAPIDLHEAQANEAGLESLVYQAENNLNVARSVLRQDVMHNPSHTFLPQQIEPSDTPSGAAGISAEEEKSLELAMEYRPELAGMREAIKSMLLQVKYAENQTLPQLNFGGQIGLSATSGTANGSCFGLQSGTPCTPSAPNYVYPPPFGGVYGDALNRLFRFTWYSYAVALSFEQPLDNSAAKAALAQAKIQYEQERMNYRSEVSGIVVDVESALSGVGTGIRRVRAARIATSYARESLQAEQQRYKVGMATTHDLLQYQNALVVAMTNQANAEVGLEQAKIALRHSEGILLNHFDIRFMPQNPDKVRPWYSRF